MPWHRGSSKAEKIRGRSPQLLRSRRKVCSVFVKRGASNRTAVCRGLREQPALPRGNYRRSASEPAAEATQCSATEGEADHVDDALQGSALSCLQAVSRCTKLQLLRAWQAPGLGGHVPGARRWASGSKRLGMEVRKRPSPSGRLLPRVCSGRHGLATGQRV